MVFQFIHLDEWLLNLANYKNLKMKRSGNEEDLNSDDSVKRFKMSDIHERNVLSESVKEKKEYGGFEWDSAGVIQMSFIKNSAELDSLHSLPQYKAEYPENIFKKETVKGLKNPKIRLFFTPIRLRVYIEYNVDKKAPNYDDLLEYTREHFFIENSERIHTESLEEFDNWVEEELSTFHDKGKIVAVLPEVHSNNDKDGEINSKSSASSYEIRKFNQWDEEFLHKFNGSYQSYLFLDIDNWSVIEEDPYWDYYILFEKSNSNYSIAGFVTIYKSYHSLDKFRMRISQFVILPHYQRKGLATKLYDIVHQKFLDKPECFEITMESPTSIMNKIQNTFILKNLYKLGFLDKLLNKDKQSFVKVTKDNLEKLINLSIDDKIKLSKASKGEIIKVSRIYEFLICQLIETQDIDTFCAFRIHVKKRFF